jgi:hypothetical protein
MAAMPPGESSLAHETESIGEAESVGGGEGGDFAQRVPGDEGGFEVAQLLVQRRQRGRRAHVEGGLGVVSVVEVGFGAVPAQVGESEVQVLVGFGKDGAGGGRGFGQRFAHADEL